MRRSLAFCSTGTLLDGDRGCSPVASHTLSRRDSTHFSDVLILLATDVMIVVARTVTGPSPPPDEPSEARPAASPWRVDAHRLTVWHALAGGKRDA